MEGLYIAPSLEARSSSFAPSVSSSSSSHQSSRGPLAEPSSRGKVPPSAPVSGESGSVKVVSSKSSQLSFNPSLPNGSNVPGSAVPALSTLEESEYSNSDSHQSTLSSKLSLTFLLSLFSRPFSPSLLPPHKILTTHNPCGEVFPSL